MPATPLRHELSDEAGAPTPAWTIPVLRLALAILGQRVLFWLVTLGAGAVWTLTAIHPEPWRLATAVAYSGVVLWPFLYHDLKRQGGG